MPLHIVTGDRLKVDSFRSSRRVHLARLMARKRRPEPLGDERTDANAPCCCSTSHTKAITPHDVLTAQVVAPDDLTHELVEGVADHRERLDRAIAAHAKGWTLARMPIIDLTIMRCARTPSCSANQTCRWRSSSTRPSSSAKAVLDRRLRPLINGVLAALVKDLRLHVNLRTGQLHGVTSPASDGLP